MRLNNLDMTREISNRQWKCSGGYADIYIAEVNGSAGLVAIKRVRLPGKDEMIAFTKVRLLFNAPSVYLVKKYEK